MKNERENMITREEIRIGFTECITNKEKSEFCKFHMEQEQQLPGLYTDLTDDYGRKLFKFENLHKCWNSDNPKEYHLTKK